LKESLRKTIFEVTKALVVKCTFEKRLRVTFYKTPYLGAAHGVIGVLYMVIQAMNMIPELHQDKSI
jgi:hypothetical protein